MGNGSVSSSDGRVIDPQHYVQERPTVVATDGGTQTVTSDGNLQLAVDGMDEEGSNGLGTGEEGRGYEVLSTERRHATGKIADPETVRIIRERGLGIRSSSDDSQSVSQAYIDGATEHGAARTEGGDGRTRITARSEIQDVTVDAQGNPTGQTHVGRLTLGTFEKSIADNVDSLMSGFEAGEVVDLGPAPNGSPQRFTVSDDPRDPQMLMLRNALKQTMIRTVEEQFGTSNKDAVFTSNTINDRRDGSFGELNFVENADGTFVLITGGEPEPTEGIDAWDVRRVTGFGYTHGMVTTSSPDGARQGWSHSAARDSSYFMGRVNVPDPENPGENLWANIKGFNKPRLSSDASEIQVTVHLADGDAVGGRLNDSVTLEGAEAIDFLTRVGVLEENEGSYSVAVNTFSNRASGGTRSYTTETDVFPWANLRALADTPILAGLDAGGDTAPLMQALLETHDKIGDGTYSYGLSRTAGEAQFSEIAGGWIAGWQATVADMRAAGKSDAEISQHLRQEINDTLKDWDAGDPDYSQFVSIIGTRTLEANISDLMAE